MKRSVPANLPVMALKVGEVDFSIHDYDFDSANRD